MPVSLAAKPDGRLDLVAILHSLPRRHHMSHPGSEVHLRKILKPHTSSGLLLEKGNCRRQISSGLQTSAGTSNTEVTAGVYPDMLTTEQRAPMSEHKCRESLLSISPRICKKEKGKQSHKK